MLLWQLNLGQAAGRLAEAPINAPALAVMAAIGDSPLANQSSIHLNLGSRSAIHSGAGVTISLTDSPVGSKSELE